MEEDEARIGKSAFAPIELGSSYQPAPLPLANAQAPPTPPPVPTPPSTPINDIAGNQQLAQAFNSGLI